MLHKTRESREMEIEMRIYYIVRLCNFRAPVIVNYSAVLFTHRNGHLFAYSSIEKSCNLYHRRNREETTHLHPNYQTRPVLY